MAQLIHHAFDSLKLGARPPPPELSPHYYRDNFLTLIETVKDQYGDMLSPSETDFLQRFEALSLQAQCLYLRLISRKGPWFRRSKLEYAEIGNLDTPLEALLSAQLMVSQSFADIHTVTTLYSNSELQTLFGAQLEGSNATRKADKVAHLETLGLTTLQIADILSQHDPMGLIAPLCAEHLHTLEILFFGNRHQSLTEFVLAQIGVTQYFPYPLKRDQRLFPDRAALEQYLQCTALADARDDAIANGDGEALKALATTVAALRLTDEAATRRWHTLCNRMGRDLERLDESDLALCLYRYSTVHPARERQVRILERSKKTTDALDLCEDILDNPWCEAERDAALRIMPRLQKRLGRTPHRQPKPRFTEQHIQLPDEQRPVELTAADYFAREWRVAEYVENRLMNTLFGLLFWEEIYAPVPGAFHHPFQSVPADMYSPLFAIRRSQAIAEKFALLRRADITQRLSDAYHRYSHFQCHWINTRYVDLDILRDAVTIIPRDDLLHIFERILFDPKENRSGFPDLITLGDAPGDYCLMEVKGPGDSLQNNQKRWLGFFAEAGIPAKVVWVSWSGAATEQ